MTKCSCAVQARTHITDADILPFNTEEIRNCKIVTSISRAQFGKFKGQLACFFVFKADLVKSKISQNQQFLTATNTI